MKVTEKITADNAVKGFSDISGVKQEGGSAAEVPVLHEACAEKGMESEEARSDESFSFAGGVRFGDVLPENDSAFAEADEEAIDAEFEALIKGKYRRAYQKRMASTVRKRLRNGRARSVSEAVPNVRGEDPVFCESTENACTPEVAASEVPVDRSDELIEAQKNKNRSRPTENGVGESVGIVTRINVSALSGSDILGIIRRAGTGEKITF